MLGFLHEEGVCGASKRPKSGQIWSVKMRITAPGRKRPIKIRPEPARPEMVLIFRADQPWGPTSVIQILPISYLRIFAGSYDLAFTAENSPMTNEGIMVECWNLQPMLQGNLDFPVVTVSPEVLSDARYLSSCFIHDQEVDSAKLQSRGYTGTPIEDEQDPRVRFEQEQVSLTAYLRAPANLIS